MRWGLLLFVFWSFAAGAVTSATPTETTFGPEFEFVSQPILDSWQKDELVRVPNFDGVWTGAERSEAQRFAYAVRRKCAATPGCRIHREKFKHPGEYLVTFSDGWWFRVSYDPGCIEIQSREQTIPEMNANIERARYFIFDTAKSLGFTADPAHVSSHLNIGFFSLFGRKKSVVRNALAFFLDYNNFPELANGALGQRDLYNARPMTVMPVEFQTQMGVIIRAAAQDMFDLGEFFTTLHHYVFNPITEGRRMSMHYQSMNFENIVQTFYEEFKKKDSTLDFPFEIRALYPQASPEQFILTSELFLLRAKHVKLIGNRLAPLFWPDRKYTDEQLVSKFYLYVVDAGGDFEHFRPLLAERLRTVSPDKFVLDQPLDLNKKTDFNMLKNYIPMIFISGLAGDRVMEFFEDKSNFDKKYFPDALEVFLKKAESIRSYHMINAASAYLNLFNLTAARYLIHNLKNDQTPENKTRLLNLIERSAVLGAWIDDYFERQKVISLNRCSNLFEQSK